MRRLNSLHTMTHSLSATPMSAQSIVKHLQRIADLAVQAIMFAVVRVGTLIRVRVVPTIAQLEKARIDVWYAPLHAVDDLGNLAQRVGGAVIECLVLCIERGPTQYRIRAVVVVEAG
jgi:hypothetical protein